MSGTVWVVIAFGLSQVLRLGSNVVLTRLLAPEIFGLIILVFSIRTGLALMSDMGIGQSIIYNKDAEKPQFYQTAWTIELGRNLLLWLLCLAIASPIASLYGHDELAPVIAVATLSIVIRSLASPAYHLARKRMQIQRVTTFDLTIAFIESCAVILLAVKSCS